MNWMEHQQDLYVKMISTDTEPMFPVLLQEMGLLIQIKDIKDFHLMQILSL